MITYEVHSLKKGAAVKDWALEAVFEDRELSIHEATLMYESDRYAGIRVIAEDHDATTGKIQTSTVYRGGSNFKEAKAKASAGTASMSSRAEVTPRDYAPKPRPAATVEKRSVTSLVPMLLLFLAIGIGGMYVLYELVPD